VPASLEPYLSLEHIESGTCKILSQGKASDVKSTKSLFAVGDVLYGKLRLYLNKVCIPDFDGVCSTDIFVFIPSESLLNELLLRFLSQSSFVEYASMKSQGINLPRLGLDEMLAYPLGIPTIEEQRKIIQRIELLFVYADSILEQAKASLKELDRLDQSILAKAFRGELVPQDPNDEPASVLLERIKAEREKAQASKPNKRKKKATSC